jgi:hypothetical protein
MVRSLLNMDKSHILNDNMHAARPGWMGACLKMNQFNNKQVTSSLSHAAAKWSSKNISPRHSLPHLHVSCRGCNSPASATK